MIFFIVASIVAIVAASQQSSQTDTSGARVTDASRVKKYAIPSITQQQFIPVEPIGYEVIKHLEVPIEKVELNVVEKKVPYFVDVPVPITKYTPIKVTILRPYVVHVPVSKHAFIHKYYKTKGSSGKDQ